MSVDKPQPSEKEEAEEDYDEDDAGGIEKEK